jgi:hypothetical protein
MTDVPTAEPGADPIPAITPRGTGHQFVIYADSCSGVPGGIHEDTFAQVNRIAASLTPKPEFILFPGDEIVGLTGDPEALRRQWRYWADVEMKWQKDAKIPLYLTTGNHTVYDDMSESVFREVLSQVPQNGPRGQGGLSYAVRRGDLLLACLNTVWSGLGGEGHVETDWISDVLHEHRDAAFKLVVGHHPIHAVNGYTAPCQHIVSPDLGAQLWAIFRDNGVLAYVAAHILAFDAQVHDGVLQLTTAGGGAKHRMPEGAEYLHCVQAALDAQGLQYQVLDVDGQVREGLRWPVVLPRGPWSGLSTGAPVRAGLVSGTPQAPVFLWRVAGRAAADGTAEQTLLSATDPDGLPALWIGLRGPQQTLTVTLKNPVPGRTRGYWQGPDVRPGSEFEFQVMVHADMGPGGVLYRLGDGGPWSSLRSSSPWGAERLALPDHLTIGHAGAGAADRPFLGQHLSVSVISS